MFVLACRGCCCGTSKHPDVNHDQQLRALEATGVPFDVTPCLGPCRWSNVMVAVDDHGEQHWFAKMLADEDVAAVTGWLRDPDTHPRPDHLTRSPIGRDRDRVAQLARDHRRARRFVEQP